MMAYTEFTTSQQDQIKTMVKGAALKNTLPKKTDIVEYLAKDKIFGIDKKVLIYGGIALLAYFLLFRKKR